MTLPLHDDGGIDYSKIKIVQNTIFIDERFLPTDVFIHLIAAHTRERCALWHDEKANEIEKDAGQNYILGLAGAPSTLKLIIQVHRDSAAALRKMED